jgi:hypothetical protein
VSKRAPAAAALSSRQIGGRGGGARRSLSVCGGTASGGTGRARRSGRRWCCSWCWRSWCCLASWPSLWWCCCCSPACRTWRCGRASGAPRLPVPRARQGRPPAGVRGARTGRLLGDAGSAAMEAALRDGVVPFRVDGEAQTRWKVAGIVGVD